MGLVVLLLEAVLFHSMLAVSVYDFRIEYKKVIARDMILENNPVHGPYIYSQVARDKDTTVRINVTLNGNAEIPSGFQIRWEFGNEVITNQLVRGYHIYRTYESRGVYDFSVTITGADGFNSSRHSITIGLLISFTAADYNVTVNSELVTFYVTPNTGLTPTPTYEIETGDGTTITSTTHTYTSRNLYLPKVTSKYNELSETVYLDLQLSVDVDISSILELRQYVNNVDSSAGYLSPGSVLTVTLPPGDSYADIALVPTTKLQPKQVTCNLTTGDTVNRTIISYIHDPSASSSLQFNFRYWALGDATVEAICYNSMSEYRSTLQREIVNPCFEINEMFDRAFSMPETPMRVFTAENLTLFSRMIVNCSEQQVTYEWRITDEHAQSDVSFVNPVNPTTNTLFIPAYTIKEGLYKIEMKIIIPYPRSTYVEEYTYINFIEPTPRAYIAGGRYRLAKNSDKVIVIDARSESYQWEKIDDNNGSLIFTWSCVLKNESGSFSCDGEVDLDGDGIWNLTISTNFLEYDIKVTVTAVNGNKFASFLQNIKRVPDHIPIVQINCTFNCNEKVAVTRRLIYTAFCVDCLSSVIKFHWTLSDSSNSVVLENITYSGVNRSSVIIKENTLLEGEEYNLTVTQTEWWSRCRRYWHDKTCDPKAGGTPSISTVFITNTKPKALSCQVDPVQGYSIEGNFTINCTVTSFPPEPVYFTFRATKWSKSDTGDDYLKDIIDLYSGGEIEINKVSLPSGHPELNYSVLITVSVTDRIGDGLVIFEQNITVLPLNDTVPENENDVSNIQHLFDVFEHEMTVANGSGNYLKQLQLIGAVATHFRNFSKVILSLENLTEIFNTTANATQMCPVSDTHFKESSVLLKYYEKTSYLLHLISNILDLVSSLNMTGFPENVVLFCDNRSNIQNISSYENVTGQCSSLTLWNINQITWILVDLTHFPQYVSQTFLDTAFNILMSFIDTLLRTASIKPFKMMYKDTLDNTYLGILRFLQNALKVIQPREDVTPADDEETKIAQLRHNATIIQCDTLLNETLSRRESIYNDAINMTETYTMKIYEIIGKIQKVTLLNMAPGEGLWNISLGGISVNVNKSKLRDVYSGDSSALLYEEQEDTVEIEETEFELDPHKAINNTKVINSAVKARRTTSKYPIPIRHRDKRKRHFTKVRATYSPGEEDQLIYIQANFDSSDKALIIYLKPEGVNIKDRRTISLYTVYIRRKRRPTSTKYHFKKTLTVDDWVSDAYGYKIFVHRHICKKGDCFLGIKPLRVLMSQSTTNETNTSNPTATANLETSTSNPTTTETVSIRKKRSSNTTASNSMQENGTQTTSTMSTTDIMTIRQNSNKTVSLQNVDIDTIVIAVGCFAIVDDLWSTKTCEVLPLSTMNETICRCIQEDPTVKSDFAASFDVPSINVPNFDAFLNFDFSNAAVYSTIIAVMIVYALAALYLRRQDKKDLQKWSIGILCDNGEEDDYFYLITVMTGLRRGAGTKSVVNFILYGDTKDTGVRILSDNLTKGFETGSVCRFIMSCNENLGHLMYLWIWHDFSGSGWERNWYLRSISFHDLQSNERYVFQCDSWLAMDKANGVTECLLPASGYQDFKVLFSEHVFFNITENNLWLSTIFRPEESCFTRVQRLTCLVTFLFLSMVANMMFYRSPDEEELKSGYRIGSITISISIIYTSIVSVAVTAPPIIIVSFVFKNSRKKNDSVSLSNRLSDNGPIVFSAKKPLLPYCSRFIAWIILVLTICATSVIMLAYSMDWGKEKTNEWMSAFLLSFIESATCVDPLKVLVIAVFFTLLSRKADETVITIKIKELKDYCSWFAKKRKKEYTELVSSIFFKKRPSISEESKLMSSKRKQIAAARKGLFDLIVSIALTGIVTSIGYSELDTQSFTLQNSIQNYISSDGYGQFGFTAVNDSLGFYVWMENTFLPTFYPEKEYNDDDLGILEKQKFGDLSSIRVGPARIRQVRMKKESCKSTVIPMDQLCVENYDTYAEDTGSYCQRWNLSAPCVNSGNEFIPDARKYVDSSSIWGLPLTGLYNTYSGGGYILEMTGIRLTTTRKLNEARNTSWIDRQTRAVMTEFTLYNPNVNIFISSTFLLEFLEHGLAIPSVQLLPFRRALRFEELSQSLQAAYVFLIIYMTVLTVDLISRCVSEGIFTFVKQVWNILDTAYIFISVACIVLLTVRLGRSERAMEIFYDQKYTGEDKYINFNQIVVLSIAIQISLGFMSFLSILRILRIFQYNKRVSAISRVVTHSAKALTGFCVVFVISLFAFGFLVFLLFGKTVYSFSSLVLSFSSLANTLIGKNDVKVLMEASPLFAIFFYFMYGCSVTFLLLNIFAAILNESITSVKREIYDSEGQYGIMDYTVGSLKDMLGSLKRLPEISNAGTNQKHPRWHVSNSDITFSDIFRILRWIFSSRITTQSEENDVNDSKDAAIEVSVETEDEDKREERATCKEVTFKIDKTQEFRYT